MRRARRRGVAALVLAWRSRRPGDRRQRPALDYALDCEGCHRADGTGTPGSVPALRDSVARFLAVPGGREYLARVPGVAQAPLDDAALAAVLNWMLDHFDARARAGRLRAVHRGRRSAGSATQPLLDVEGSGSSCWIA